MCVCVPHPMEVSQHCDGEEDRSRAENRLRARKPHLKYKDSTRSDVRVCARILDPSGV